MNWSYTGRPGTSLKDEVRFLIGDTCEKDPLVSDEEIAYALSKFSVTRLAGAVCLRSALMRLSRSVTWRAGDASENASDLAKALKDRLQELDPGNETLSGFVIPRFGGQSLDEKRDLADDSDAVQPSFSIGMNDIPGGPGESVIWEILTDE
jgi:hypothetical protein